MRVLFILDPFQVEPLGVGYLASALKWAGIETDWLKANDERLINKICAYSPGVLAYSVSTGKHQKFIALNQEIKKQHSAISIFGGSHPTYYPEMIRENGVDIIIRGEAEQSFIEILNSLHTKGISKRVFEFYPLNQDLDSIAFPDREFLYKYQENLNNPIKNVLTSRGCRFSCPYCFNSVYRGFYRGQKWVRYRSPKNVIDECLDLMQYPLGMIYFQDDEFLTNPGIDELLHLYRKSINIPFHCQIRIELLTDEVARELKVSGCSGVTFAIESGNDHIRREILSRRMSKKTIIAGAECLHRHGLKFRTENMIGLPGENFDQMLDTLDINIRCRPTYGWASIFQPYPRLPLTEYARELDLWDGNVDDFCETFFEKTALKTNLAKEITNIQRLFGLAVNFPVLRKPIRWLAKFPNNMIYGKLCSWWKQKRFRQLYSEAYK